MIEQYNITLQPLIEATPAAFTMDTLGWKILFYLILIFLLFITYRVYQHYKSNQYRRDAISRINILNSSISDCDFITQTMFTIKQTAITTYDRKTVAALNGTDWLSFLDEKVNSTNFNKNKTVIASAIYQNKLANNSDFNRIEFKTQSINWIKNHA